MIRTGSCCTGFITQSSWVSRFHSCTSPEGVSLRGQPLNIFIWFIGAGRFQTIQSKLKQQQVCTSHIWICDHFDICDQNVTKSVLLKKLKKNHSLWPRSQIQNCDILFQFQFQFFTLNLKIATRQKVGDILLLSKMSHIKCDWYKTCFCFCLECGLEQLSYKRMFRTRSGTANPIWGDIFESSFKAQSSKLERLFSLKRVKRDVRPLSFELWALSFERAFENFTPSGTCCTKRTGGASDIVKAESSGEDPRATGGLISNHPHPRVNKTKQH